MSIQLLKTSSTHSTSIVSIADTALASARETVISTGWSPVTKLAEWAVVRTLRRLTLGQLRITTSSTSYVFGEQIEQKDSDAPYCHIRVIKDSFWLRLAVMSDLGFSEAFMYGEIEISSLLDAFKLFIINRAALSNLSNFASYLVSLPQTILTSTRFLNTVSNTRSNISAQYDISNHMFASFLSRDMTYSCGIFPDLNGDLRPLKKGSEIVKNVCSAERTTGNIIDGYSCVADDDDTPSDPLYDAQMRKLLHIIRKADIKPGHRVLEIGSGWGALAILAVQLTGCTVDTLTLSSEQQALAEERIKAAGLSSHITVHLMDYRKTPKCWNASFDRFISIEMMEHVGREFLEAYWGVVDKLLKPTGAVGVVQLTTIPESRLERYSREVDFIRKWIFPGGFLPSLTLLISALEHATSGRLLVDSVSNIGPHYSRTLREWRGRFETKFDSEIAPALRAEYPDVMGDDAGERGREEMEVFKRKWIYYFSYSEIGFTERILGVHIITFTREGATGYGCQI